MTGSTNPCGFDGRGIRIDTHDVLSLQARHGQGHRRTSRAATHIQDSARDADLRFQSRAQTPPVRLDALQLALDEALR